jgi:hypothetical protein
LPILVDVENFEFFKKSLLLLFKLSLTCNIKFGMLCLTLSLSNHHGIGVLLRYITNKTASHRCCTCHRETTTSRHLSRSQTSTKSKSCQNNIKFNFVRGSYHDKASLVWSLGSRLICPESMPLKY